MSLIDLCTVKSINSNKMQMPVAILTRQEVFELRQAMTIQEHVQLFEKKLLYLTFLKVEDRLHLGKTQIKFGFSLDLHYLCSANIIMNGILWIGMI